MTFAALLTLAAAAISAPPQPEHGVQLAQAQVQVVILKAAVVRQGSGPEIAEGAPVPQIIRRGGRILVEYQ